MAVSIVQIGNGAFGSAASAGIGGYSATPKAGNKLIVAAACPRPFASVTGPTGYSFVGSQDNGGANCCVAFWLKISAGNENTFTISWSGGTGNWSIVTYEVAGLSNQLIGGDRTSANTASATTITNTNLSANQLPDELGIFAVAAPNAMGALVSGPTGGFNDDTAGGAQTGQFQWCSSKVMSAVETSTSTITWTTSRVVASRLHTFKGASLDPPAPTSFITPS